MIADMVGRATARYACGVGGDSTAALRNNNVDVLNTGFVLGDRDVRVHTQETRDDDVVSTLEHLLTLHVGRLVCARPCPSQLGLRCTRPEPRCPTGRDVGWNEDTYPSIYRARRRQRARTRTRAQTLLAGGTGMENARNCIWRGEPHRSMRNLDGSGGPRAAAKARI
ncbi:hypothetical protein BD413DRAFT_290787 [Trametes elegans]|nr:hypothetical protein BD413DRAFT_290787 [Trametes elegans]